VRERKWRRWIEDPSLRRGRVGELLDVAAACGTLEELSRIFQEIGSAEVAPFERDLRILKLAVTAAPLLGLLGTVTGMLTTFAALASGAGGDETMKMVASGISEALVTTETGLVVALPGLFLHYRLSRSVEEYKVFLAHLESVLAQRLFRLQHGEEAA
jgi:biopolymer transport protein ExbB